jgi:hypothetical protein
MAEDDNNSGRLQRLLSGLTLKHRRNRIPRETLSAYSAFLDNPHSHGYWRLTAKWLTDGQVQNFLANGYRAMWAAEYETAVRSAVDTTRLAGAGSFQTILQTIA